MGPTPLSTVSTAVASSEPDLEGRSRLVLDGSRSDLLGVPAKRRHPSQSANLTVLKSQSLDHIIGYWPIKLRTEDKSEKSLVVVGAKALPKDHISRGDGFSYLFYTRNGSRLVSKDCLMQLLDKTSTKVPLTAPGPLCTTSVCPLYSHPVLLTWSNWHPDLSVLSPLPQAQVHPQRHWSVLSVILQIQLLIKHHSNNEDPACL